MQEIENHLEVFNKYKHLWKKTRSDEIDNFMSAEKDIMDFEDKIKFYLNVMDSVDAEKDEMTVGCITLCLSLLLHLFNFHKFLLQMIKEFLQVRDLNTISSFQKSF